MKVILAVVMVVITAAIRAAMAGKVYKVGDSAGWSNIGHVDYKTWASTKVFRVGDTIVFAYNKDFHNVARVSYTDFLTCDGANPYAVHTSGNYSFPIIYPGHYYFICTIPGHCEAGQKVDIRVPIDGGHSSMPPASASSPSPLQPLPFPYPPPNVPSPSPVSRQPSQSPSPSATEESPSSSPASQTPKVAPPETHAPKIAPSTSPAADTPEIAPSPPKNSASQLGKCWISLMVVLFYLNFFSF